MYIKVIHTNSKNDVKIFYQLHIYRSYGNNTIDIEFKRKYYKYADIIHRADLEDV